MVVIYYCLQDFCRSGVLLFFFYLLQLVSVIIEINLNPLSLCNSVFEKRQEMILNHG